MDALRVINASKAFSKGILKCTMIVVIPIEPTLVVTTRSPVVTELLTNAAFSFHSDHTPRAMPPSFLVSNRDWWILRWIKLHIRVTWEFNSVAFENICGGDEICCEEPRFVVDRPFGSTHVAWFLLFFIISFTISF